MSETRGLIMDHDDKSPVTTNPTWLAQIDPVGPVATTSPPKKSKRWPVLIGFVLMLMVLSCAAVFISSRSNNCFNTSNYEKLAALVKTVNNDITELGDLQSYETFYTHAIYFEQDTTNFDTDSEIDPTNFLKSLGAYYQKDYANAPITIQVTTRYMAADELSLAEKRNTRVRDMLVEAGFSESAITTPQPSLVQATEDSTGEVDDDIADGQLPILVSITPLSICTSGD